MTDAACRLLTVFDIESAFSKLVSVRRDISYVIREERHLVTHLVQDTHDVKHAQGEIRTDFVRSVV